LRLKEDELFPELRRHFTAMRHRSQLGTGKPAARVASTVSHLFFFLRGRFLGLFSERLFRVLQFCEQFH
jgi:hypothetical protein